MLTNPLTHLKPVLTPMLRTSINPALHTASHVLYSTPCLRSLPSFSTVVPTSHLRNDPAYLVANRSYGTVPPPRHTYNSDSHRSKTVYDKQSGSSSLDESKPKSISERFIEEFNKKHPLSLSTEVTVAVLGGIPIMLARFAVHNITIRALAKKQTDSFNSPDPEPHISSSTYDQYQRTMRYSTLALGLLVALLGLCGVNDIAYMVWSYMGQTGHRKCIKRLPYPIMHVCAFFGLPYALFIANFVTNETNYVRHLSNYICFADY